MMLNGPVVIGGIGGSGTRVVAEMLAGMGYFLGTDLNDASDNLSYTLLFKRPAWFRKNFKKQALFFRGLSILEKAMVTGESFNLRERLFLARATREMSQHGHNTRGEGKGEWAYERKSRIISPVTPDLSAYRGWGWKEPNSHLLVPLMHSYFPGLKYIHTIRHGLDMAFSTNQQQLFNWASLYGVELPATEESLPVASLRYWIKANLKVYELAEKFGEQSVLVLNFDDLCRDPVAGLKKIAAFLDMELTGQMREELIELPAIPSSSGRYRQYPPDVFEPKDIQEVEKLGFDCSY